MNCLRIHNLRRRRIDNKRVNDFIEECDEKKLYILDIDSYLGREMNFKIYRELEGIYELWIDSAPRTNEDVMDILVSGGDVAVIMNEFLRKREMEKIIEITDNIALKSIFIDNLKKFIELGGKIIISSVNMGYEIKDVELYTMRNREVCEWKT